MSWLFGGGGGGAFYIFTYFFFPHFSSFRFHSLFGTENIIIRLMAVDVSVRLVGMSEHFFEMPQWKAKSRRANALMIFRMPHSRHSRFCHFHFLRPADGCLPVFGHGGHINLGEWHAWRLSEQDYRLIFCSAPSSYLLWQLASCSCSSSQSQSRSCSPGHRRRFLCSWLSLGAIGRCLTVTGAGARHSTSLHTRRNGWLGLVVALVQGQEFDSPQSHIKQTQSPRRRSRFLFGLPPLVFNENNNLRAITWTAQYLARGQLVWL